MLQRKVPYANRILAGWENQFGNRETRLNEANDSIVFATTGDEDKRGSKKKEVTCFKCKMMAHYSNECDEDTVKMSNKKGMNFLDLNDELQDSSPEEEAGIDYDSNNLWQYKRQYKRKKMRTISMKTLAMMKRKLKAKITMNMRVLHLSKKMYYVQSRQASNPKEMDTFG